MTSLFNASFGRTNDKKKLITLYDQLEIAGKLWAAGGWLKEDYYRHFQQISRAAKTLKEKIETFDYREQDKMDSYWLSTPPPETPPITR